MNAVTSVIVLLILGLAATLAFELRPMPSDAPDPAIRTPIPAVPPAPADAASAGGAALLDVLLGRPLFSATRRPPDAAVSAAAPDTPLPRMTAILVDGPRRSAIFAPPGGAPIRVAEGGHVGSFTVQSIEPQQVVVLGPQGKRVVRTSFDPNPPTPAPPLAAPTLTAPLSAPPGFPGIAGGPNPPRPFAPAVGPGYGAAR